MQRLSRPRHERRSQWHESASVIKRLSRLMERYAAQPPREPPVLHAGSGSGTHLLALPPSLAVLQQP